MNYSFCRSKNDFFYEFKFFSLPHYMQNIKIDIAFIRAKLREFYTLPIALVYIGIMGILTSVIIIAVTQNVKVFYLMDDAIRIGQLKFYAGFVASIIVLLWCVGGTVSFLGYWLLDNCKDTASRNFLLWGGFLSFMLLFDDLFLIHETIGDHTIIPEVAIFSLYGLLIIYYLIRYQQVILKTNFLFLFLSLAFLALSIAIDIHLFIPKKWHHTSMQTGVEESCELIGITHWALYHCKVAYQLIKTNVNAS
ncbi:MAG: hypothetical protein EAZ08_08255 [Cytophagales bacterium]|nr:MAG: hypothetical protein EAZ08_08255 [Cytophagales bacterium]